MFERAQNEGGALYSESELTRSSDSGLVTGADKPKAEVYARHEEQMAMLRAEQREELEAMEKAGASYEVLQETYSRMREDEATRVQARMTADECAFLQSVVNSGKGADEVEWVFEGIRAAVNLRDENAQTLKTRTWGVAAAILVLAIAILAANSWLS